MNIGLINPKTVIDLVIKKSQEQSIPINSLEGFIRQIIGWREFIRGGIIKMRGVVNVKIFGDLEIKFQCRSM